MNISLPGLPVAIRAATRRDLVAHYRWFEAEAGSDVADRFLSAANDAFQRLADQPRMGRGLLSRDTHLLRLRESAVSGFPNMLIFYEPRDGGISVVRIIHAARDWWGLIGDQ